MTAVLGILIPFVLILAAAPIARGTSAGQIGQILIAIIGVVMICLYFAGNATKDELAREAENPHYNGDHRASDFDFWGRRIH